MASPGGNRQNNMGGSVSNLAQELQWVKNDCVLIRNAVVLLEQEKDNLRQAVRKLKLENQRQREKTKKLQAEVKRLGGNTEETDEEEKDYDDIGKDFLLIGGAQDPFALRYEVSIRDGNGVEHKSAERYYWYKLAEHFEDEETKKRILDAPTTIKAEEAMKDVKGFKEDEWDKVKMEHWEHGQELKLKQVRWIACLLVETKGLYLAVAHQDKQIGTGWRKNREEANKPIFWDGANLGGKWLMKFRKELAGSHEWTGPNEKEETRKKFLELKKFVWRRIDQNRVGPGMGGMMRGGGYGMRGGRGAVATRGGFGDYGSRYSSRGNHS